MNNSTVEERNLIQQSEDIKNIMRNESTRRFMWRVLSYCGIYRDVEGESLDIQKQLGRRQVGLFLLGILSDVDDEQVFTMMREAKNKKQEDTYARHREQNASDGDYTASHNYDSGNALSDYI